MASGSAVIADPDEWGGLRAMDVRKITVIEMEAATIATVAHDRGLPWLVAKGVMDHADSKKDDRYKQLAASLGRGDVRPARAARDRRRRRFTGRARPDRTRRRLAAQLRGPSGAAAWHSFRHCLAGALRPTADVMAQRAAAVARRTITHKPNASNRLSKAELYRLAGDFRAVREALTQADPADKAELYQRLRVTLTYDPINTESASWPRRTRIPMGLWCVSEG
jgi:hypothetical protein